LKSDWVKLKLRDLADIKMGQSPKSKYYNVDKIGLPFFQGCTEFSEFYPIVKKYCSKPTRIANKGDILMSVRAPVGKLNIAKDECCIGRGLCAISPKNKGRFIYYLLKSNLLKIQSFSTGSTYQSINRKEVNSLTFHVPSLDNQKKITSVLTNYDNLIENNNRRIEILEEMAQRIYKEWFVDFKYPGHENDKLVDSELGMIPNNWEVMKVEDIIERIKPGKLYNKNTVEIEGSIPVLDQGRSGIIGFHNNEPGMKASISNPVIVFANHTCYQNLIFYPFSAIQNVLPFVPSSKNNRNIFWLHWTTKDIIKFNDYKGHWPEFISKKITLPPDFLCHDFGNTIKDIVILKYRLESKNKLLMKTRDYLLPKLISGKVDVSDLDINTDILND